MPRFSPAAASALPEFRDVIEAIDRDHGYVPNSFLTMGRLPELLRATGAAADAFWYSALPQPSLRHLAAFAYSFFSAAMYSAAHTGCTARENGVPVEKLAAVADFETSPLYSEMERAVLRLCRAAARTPAEVRDEHLAALGEHFDEIVVLRLVGLLAWHAALNKWNDLCGTQLELKPRAFAQSTLAPIGWHIRSHG